jgi:hypothetical protein
VVENFGLETGRALLERWFAEVRLARYEDGLVVDEVEPVVAYVRSMTDKAVDEGAEEAFERFLENKLATSGAIRIAKEVGLFKAQPETLKV